MFQFSLRQLSLFAETAKCGGIAQAARNLNVSPAAVASAIDKLEDTTGLVLFDRFPARGLRLTPTGAELS
ncbi:MAG: LysR family transcriptional regulator [Rhodobacteraceae bacterium]|nr:LysR family transcriptional regulator [Paracoccaceae bacterium]